MKSKKNEDVVSKENKDSSMRSVMISTAVSAVVSTLITTITGCLMDAFKPVDPRVVEQIENLRASTEHLKAASQKDALFIELARTVTGQADAKTVEKVKREVIDYLTKALKGYPTWDEFNRDRHRYVDKAQGIVWENRIENGCMYMHAVAPYTNNVDGVQGAR